MHEQLDLFEETAQPPAGGGGPPVPSGVLDGMFAATPRFRDGRRYDEALRFMARFPRYSPFNAFLLFLQDPRAMYVATAGVWARQFGRRLSADARPRFILAPMSPVRFVFDLRDTRGAPFPEQLLDPAREAGPLRESEYGHTVENSRLHGIGVRETAPSDDLPAASASRLDYTRRREYRRLAPEPWMRYLALVEAGKPRAVRYGQLAHALAHVFCGHSGLDESAWWPDRTRLDGATADLEAASVAWLVCRRRGLAAESEAYAISRLTGYDAPMPPLGLTAVVQAAAYIEDMAASQWAAPRKKSRYRAAG